MMLNIEDFSKLTLDEKEIFDSIKEKFPPVHSDYLFTTMISWMDYANYHYTQIDDNIILFTNINGEMRLRPPLGKLNKSVFEEVLHLAKKLNSKFPFGMIDKPTKIWMSDNFSNFDYTTHRDYFDYVYSSIDLANLTGSSYSKIRNRYNKFKRLFSYKLEMISLDNIDDIKKFLKRWCIWKDCESDPFLDQEKKAVIFSMDNFFELGLSGTYIEINGEIEAIAVFEKMSPDTVVIHYEKASPDFEGIYKVINADTAKILQKKFKYINRESDMGVPGLRKAKMSYRPQHMIEMYHLKDVRLFHK